MAPFVPRRARARAVRRLEIKYPCGFPGNWPALGDYHL